jgi:hypothetical protein
VATTAELAALLRAGVFDLDRIEAFWRAAFDAPGGGASARVVDRIILPALGGRPLDLAPVGEPTGAVARM